MRHQPSLAATALALVIVLLASTTAQACPPSPVGLELLIEDADQAIFVKIVAVERSQADLVLEILLKAARAAREVTVALADVASEDLAWIVDDMLPEIETSRDGPIYTVTAEVLGHLDPAGPRVGSSFSWPLDFWYPQGIAPGRRAVVFVGRHQPPLAFLGLTVTGQPDSVLALADHQDAAELAAVIEAGFANKRSDRVGTEQWLMAAIRSPSSRLYLDPETAARRVSPEFLAQALIESPTGVYTDVAFLRHLSRATETHGAAENQGTAKINGAAETRLDFLALEMAEHWVASEYPGTARESIRLAIERWQLPVAEHLETIEDLNDVRELRALWRQIAVDMALPAAFNPQMQANLASWQRWIEESRQFSLDLRAAEVDRN